MHTYVKGVLIYYILLLITIHHVSLLRLGYTIIYKVGLALPILCRWKITNLLIKTPSRSFSCFYL